MARGQKKQQEKRDRRTAAQEEFLLASACARDFGVELVQHSLIHYKLRGKGWNIEIWPSTQRTHPDLKLARPFTLIDVISEAVILHNLTRRGRIGQKPTQGSATTNAPEIHTDTELAPIYGVPF